MMNVNDIQKGMDVFSSDGEKIGGVADVYPNAGADTAGTAAGAGTYSTAGGAPGTVGTFGTGDVANTPQMAGTYGASGVTGAAGAVGTGGTGYLKVDQGGILGIGAKELYFPFSAVTDVVPGENVTVNCAKDQCGDLYGTKPDFLSDDTTGMPLT